MKLLFIFNFALASFAFAGPFDDYNSQYVKYYSSQEMGQYLEKLNPYLPSINYQISVLGNSVQGKPIYTIHPRQFERGKKLVIITCRHHGDEGTSNYILEGFLASLVSGRNPQWLQKFQLVVFPMVNPDGADRMVRGNSRGLDLNRNWDYESQHQREEPEVAAIHKYINNIFQTFQTPVPIVLDLHGSFDEDFMYIGDETFVSKEYYQMQRAFVAYFGSLNPWNGGNYQHSNGEKGMFRLLMAKVHRINAMTIETPRDIPINNPQRRGEDSLRGEGIAIYQAVFDQYN